MKIIFLDVDGVLNSLRNVIAQGGFPFPKGSNVEQSPLHREENLDALAVGMVRKLCDETGAKIVLSSTWREHLDSVSEFGKRWALPIIDATPFGAKQGAISRWLEEHRPLVDKYAILDDEDMGDREHQVFTTLDDGMLLVNFKQAMEMLK